MSKFKRFISVLAVVAMIFSSISILSYAAVPSDVVDTEFEEAAKVLGALGIMVGDEGTGLFRPEDAIKRSEVTKVAVALKGLSEVADSSTATKFPDVSRDHWANGFINVGTTEGLIIGDDMGNFRPDDQITFAEAVTILVRALGYEPQAKTKGGFPSGYIVTGSSIGLTKGVSASNSKLISRGDVAELAYNALTIKLMEQVGFGNNASYEVVDKTLLSECLEVELVSGIVNAVGNASLSGAGVDKGYIKIDDKVCKTGDADVRNVLGFYVDAYIANAKGKNATLLVAVPSNGKNSVIKINADNLNSITASGSSKVVNYSEEGSSKTSKVTISNDATVIYNGMPGTWEDFDVIDSGSILLLDSEKNRKYNIVFVNETVNYVVDEVVASSDKIIDKYDQDALTLDPDNDSISFTIEKNNTAIDIEELQEWDVITLTISRDGNLVYGTVIQNAVEGEITEKDKDGFYIDGKKYMVAKNYPSELKISDKGIFYLDIEGKIAAYDNKDAISKNYAYLSDMAIKTGLKSGLEFKIFNLEGKTVTLSAASKMKVNNSSSLSYDKAYSAIGGKEQLITYELNSNGEVSRINTVSKSNEIDEDSFVLNFTEENVEYKASSSKLMAEAMNVKIDANTVIFDIPAGSSKTDDYAVRDRSFFADGGKYNVEVYDVTESLVAGVVIVTASDAKAGEETSIAVVDRVSSATNSEGDSVQKLYALQDGKEITLTTAKAGILKKDGGKNLEAGDIIQFKTNGAGEIDSITVLFDINDASTEKTTKHSDNMTTMYGKVVKKFSNSFNLSVNNGAVQNFEIGDAKVYVVEEVKSSKEVSVGSASDIQKFDDSNPERVFVRIYKDVVKEIVVIK